MRIVVLSTHFDDAVLSCYSVLGPGTTVVTVLGGLPAEGMLGDWDSAGGATSSRKRVLERREEDRQALALSNSTPVHLDFHETQHVGPAAIPTAADLVDGLRPHLTDGREVFWSAEDRGRAPTVPPISRGDHTPHSEVRRRRSSSL